MPEPQGNEPAAAPPPEPDPGYPLFDWELLNEPAVIPDDEASREVTG